MLLYCKQEIVTLLSYSQHERDFSQSILYSLHGMQKWSILQKL